MKELTYEEWQRNPTPREMWVWDDFNECEKKQKVIYISKGTYPVISMALDERYVENYKHCAEIREPRRMTNRELSRWLRENPTREYKFTDNDWIFNSCEYKEGCEEDEVNKKIRIRENYGEWKEPLTQIEY